MGRFIVVKDDKVEGTDNHKVTGQVTTPSGPVSYAGTGDFAYVGKMTDELSDFVKINGKPVALKSSKSSLNEGESGSSGKHYGPNGEKFTAPEPDPSSLSIIDNPIGEGTPSGSSGSSFVKVGATAVLLDGDKIDTCGGSKGMKNSTVTAENQGFVSCSE
jgi:uncharacterized Zn-binding protein involved in type VI secretion